MLPFGTAGTALPLNGLGISAKSPTPLPERRARPGPLVRGSLVSECSTPCAGSFGLPPSALRFLPLPVPRLPLPPPFWTAC